MKEYNGLESKFRQVLVISKRAKELMRGSKPLIKTEEKHPLKIAKKELESGKLNVKLIENEEVLQNIQ